MTLPARQYKLIPCISEEQLDAVHLHTHEAWGPKLTLQQYCDREAQIQKTDYAQLRQRACILVEEGEPEESVNWLSFGDVFYQPALLLRKGFLYEGNVVAVASVFTPRHHRRKGYAKIMLDQLLERERGSPANIATSLYTDIGPDYYAQFGYKCHPSFTFARKISSQHDDSVVLDERVSLLTLPQTCELLQAESEDIRAEFKKLQDQGCQDLKFCSLPCPLAQTWLCARSQFYLSIWQPDKNLIYTGAKSSINSDYISWSLDVQENKLRITHVKLTNPESARLLLAATVHQALVWKMDKVEMWDPSVDLQECMKNEGGWSVIERIDESVSALCLSGFVASGSAEIDLPDHEWRGNEKLVWV